MTTKLSTSERNRRISQGLKLSWKQRQAEAKHERPGIALIRKVIRKARKLLKAEPDDPSSGYRRGLVESLSWVIGQNKRFHKLEK